MNILKKTLKDLFFIFKKVIVGIFYGGWFLILLGTASLVAVIIVAFRNDKAIFWILAGVGMGLLVSYLYL